MQSVFTIDELFDACTVLFGAGISVSLDFLNYLKPEGVKAAYRRQVLSTHPDRALVTGRDSARMSTDFIRATAAYRKLNSFVTGNGRIEMTEAPAVEKTNGDNISRKNSNEKAFGPFYTGRLPGRKLLICQFLYYSGCISWNVYIDALVWQRRQRPTVGRLARDLGVLSEKEIQCILKRRALQEKFGESAIRLGLLTPDKLMALLKRQRGFQRQIGDYFVQAGILGRPQVEAMVRKQLLHNRSVP